MRWIGRLLLIVVAGYAAMLGLLFIKQRELLYPGNPARADLVQAGLAGAQEATLAAADGERLLAWVVPPRAGRPVILYFHGNAGNLASPGRVGRFKALTQDGTGLVAVSYRGYGGSTGRPSEAGLHLDARAAFGFARDRFGPSPIVGYGESLGTGVVLKLAAEVPLAAVVLEAPYLSALAVAQGVYPYVPVEWLMLDPFRSDEVIGQVRAPLLVLHGQRDGIIPFAQGEALYALANPPKRFLRFPNGGHEDLPAYGSLAEIRRFLADVDSGALKGAESLTVSE